MLFWWHTIYNIVFHTIKIISDFSCYCYMTWPFVLCNFYPPHLIKYRLVWADEAPLDHLLAAPRVQHGVTHVEQLTVIDHVCIIPVHPALVITLGSLLITHQIITSQLKSSTMFLRMVSASETRPRELCCQEDRWNRIKEKYYIGNTILYFAYCFPIS